MNNAARFSRTMLQWTVLLLGCVAATAQAAQWRYPATDRIVVFADVHGAYEELVGLLAELDIIDDTLHWTGGRTRLVSLGDLLDRGARSRDVLELLMRLEDEAGAAGGAVLVALGNHELMNLSGELDYVSAGEYAAFAADERPALREEAFERFGRFFADRSQFDARYPAGFFAHRAAFAPGGRYGSWLLRHPVLLQIGSTVFVHGGLPPLVADLGGEELNSRLSADIATYTHAFSALVDAGVLLPDAPFDQRVAAARASGADPDLVAALERTTASPAFGTEGPLWYRGSSLCNAAGEIPVTDAALARLEARRVVVGHTVNRDHRATMRFGDRVLMLDTGMLHSAYRGRPAAALIEGDSIRVHYAGEAALAAPQTEVRRIGARPGGLDDDALEDFLRRAEIVSVEDVGTGVTQPRLVQLRADGIEVRAVFKSVDTDIGGGRASRTRRAGADRLTNISDRWQYELAAYRLDRLLDLRMVPVTVERVVDGASGSLQFWIEGATNMKLRIEQGITEQGWCPLGEQYNLMFVFDTLIYNSDRTQENVLYTVEDWMVRLIDHSRAFRTLKGRPDDLVDKNIEINAEVARRLRALDEQTLRDAVGDWLDRRQIRALLDRRDELLERVTRSRGAAAL